MKKLDAVQSIVYSINHFLNSEVDYSQDYKRDIHSLGKSFIYYLIEQNLHTCPLKEININTIEDFLKVGAEKVGTWEHKRKTLKSIFKCCVDQKIIPLNPVDSVEIKSVERKLKNLFTDEELNAVFNYLKSNFPEYYLYACINYYVLYKKISTISREIKRSDFSEDFSELKLISDGKQIIVSVDNELKSVLLEQGVDKLKKEFNIFSKNTESFNRFYFTKKWGKIKKQLFDKSIINNLNYETEVFYDSAVSRYYQAHKDVKKLQQKLGFSTLFKTVYYLETIIDFEKI